ncbi:TPA: SMI1/KNR4 family protein [Cronobacter turicensis]|nr:SMI1/KNR4 family protein [Cronobacter turicensis]
MKEIQDLVKKLSASKEHEVVWLGPTDEIQVKKLENALNLSLPEDFKFFLTETGGGGVVEQEISGIEDNNALGECGGTVYYDTTYCRDEYKLPEELAVIYFKDDEICWCLDCSAENFGKVVSYDLISCKKHSTLHNSFKGFFKEYVNLRF